MLAGPQGLALRWCRGAACGTHPRLTWRATDHRLKPRKDTLLHPAMIRRRSLQDDASGYGPPTGPRNGNACILRHGGLHGPGLHERGDGALSSTWRCRRSPRRRHQGGDPTGGNSSTPTQGTQSITRGEWNRSSSRPYGEAGRREGRNRQRKWVSLSQAPTLTSAVQPRTGRIAMLPQEQRPARAPHAYRASADSNVAASADRVGSAEATAALPTLQYSRPPPWRSCPPQQAQNLQG